MYDDYKVSDDLKNMMNKNELCGRADLRSRALCLSVFLTQCLFLLSFGLCLTLCL